MMRRRGTTTILTTTLVVGFAMAVLAMPGIRLSRNVSGGGGGRVSGGHYSLGSTAGQSVVGIALGSSGRTRIHAGFWTPDGSVSGVIGEETPRIQPALLGNKPNPFNPMTEILFSVGEQPSRVRLGVYNPQGRLVRTLVDGMLPPGEHGANWDGRDASGGSCASGVFFCRLQVADQVFTGKMVLVR